MILGRSPNLALGAFVAVFSAIALVFHIDAAIVISIDGAAGAVIAFIANTPSVQIAAGEAAKARSSK